MIFLFIMIFFHFPYSCFWVCPSFNSSKIFSLPFWTSFFLSFFKTKQLKIHILKKEEKKNVCFVLRPALENVLYTLWLSIKENKISLSQQLSSPNIFLVQGGTLYLFLSILNAGILSRSNFGRFYSPLPHLISWVYMFMSLITLKEHC